MYFNFLPRLKSAHHYHLMVVQIYEDILSLYFCTDPHAKIPQEGASIHFSAVLAFAVQLSG